jgi:predicted nuclease of predicted toxin-antitoxin system
VRIFVDEDLSPSLAEECHAAGYDATCARNRDMLGAGDHEVAGLCLEEERVLVTNNAGDFFSIAEKAGIHPGLIVMPLGSREQERSWMRAAIAAIEELVTHSNVSLSDALVNKVVEVDEAGCCEWFDYP